MCWKPYKKEDISIKEFKNYLKIGIPATTLVCLEVWGIIFLGFEAGYLSTVELTAHTILMNLAALVWCIAFGISQVEATLVGNCIGAKQLKLIFRYVAACFLFAFGIFACLIIILFIFRYDSQLSSYPPP